MSSVLAAALFLVTGAFLLITYYVISEKGRLMRRLQVHVIQRARGEGAGPVVPQTRFLLALDSFARAIGVRVLTDRLERGKLSKLMNSAGMRRVPVEYGIAAKTVLGVALAVIGVFIVPRIFSQMPELLAHVSGVAGGGLIGWRIPDIALSRMARWRQDRIDAGIPDALDLLVVCAEAGLALETAMERISVEMGSSHRQLAEELALTSAEIRMLPERVQALENLAARTGVMSARIIATTLSQTFRYGTPLAQALRILANEMRTTRLLAFEARAGQLPVMLTIPMILFILPCVFLVVGGPAAVNALQTFGR